MRITSIYSYLHPLWSCARNGCFSWEETPVRNCRSSWRYLSFKYYVQLTVVGHIQHLHAAQTLKRHEFRGILLMVVGLAFLISRIRAYP